MFRLNTVATFYSQGLGMLKCVLFTTYMSLTVQKPWSGEIDGADTLKNMILSE